MDPDCGFTVDMFIGEDIKTSLSKAPDVVKSASRLMRWPPQYQLYDLKGELQRWRVETRDPMLKP